MKPREAHSRSRRTLARLFLAAAAWPDAGLVQVDEQDRGVAVEDVLGAVAVVHVPVEDEDLPGCSRCSML